MKRFVFNLLSFSLIVILLSGCRNTLINNEIELGSQKTQFEGDSLITYADLRFNKGYVCAFEMGETINSEYQLHQKFYIWNKELRNELRDNLILIWKELNKMNEKTYRFNIDFINGFSLRSGKSEILNIEKDRSTAILATLLPSSFSIDLKSFIHEIFIMIIVLEANEDTSDYEIVELNVKFDNDIKLSFNRNCYQNGILYSFEKFDEITSFMLGEYSMKDENVNTGGNHILAINEFYCDELHQGEYLWFQFCANQNENYTFYTEGQLDTKIEIYYKFNSDVVSYDDNSGENNNAFLSLDLNSDQIVYIKVLCSKVEDHGLFLLRVILTN